ncbi:ATP-binding protein [Hahella sp. KA22]|uniref:AAA family ATPase n=1 Tax=Hahella sp. KA22 TaxID=1628392 RepID=UPI000FDE2B76|nr:AAA family ATPase [Hahella sp. KA22]AZZ95074.1 ATP-binding protein [Hahella sp. KA22]QAY52719.1 ATP-binding protein [Hahella sp. KA22]
MQGVIFIGLQASGKSSFYLQQFYRTHLRLNMDMLKTRRRENILLSACIEAKQSVVIDNTNPTREGRGKYIDLFRRGRFSVAGYYFSSSLADCMARNSGREGKERIPDAGLRSVYAKMELPEYAEGFDALYYVRLDDGEFIVEEWRSEI